MNVYALKSAITSYYLSGAYNLEVTVSFCFDNGSGGTNSETNFNITGTDLVTALLINEKLQGLLSAYVNSTYGLSTSSSDILFVDFGLGL
jgi:hypothetical protein